MIKLTCRLKIIASLLSLLFIFSFDGFTIEHQYNRTLTWQELQPIDNEEHGMMYMMRFAGSENPFEDQYMPWFYELFSLSSSVSEVEITIKNQIFEPIPIEALEKLSWLDRVGNDISVEGTISYDRKKPFAVIQFTPVRKNLLTGQFERLIYFNIHIREIITPETSPYHKPVKYAGNSVLATGNWYKIAVNNTGIHKLSYQNLLDLGIPVSSINPRDIRIYGNGGGMLPENSDIFRYDDLQENAIYVYGEEDESFDQGDYILFYGQSPNVIQFQPSNGLLRQVMHLYSDYTYYFITADLGEGKRILMQNSSNQQPTNFISTFHNVIHHEKDAVNLLKSGKKWFGEAFDLTTSFIKDYNLPNIIPGSNLNFTITAAARSDNPSYFEVFTNDNKIIHLPIQATNSAFPNSDFAKENTQTAIFNLAGNNLNIRISYSKPLSSSKGWLDFFSINYTQDLVFNGGQLSFRNTSTATTPHVNKYTLAKTGPNVVIWNVSNPIDVKRVNAQLTNTEMNFVLESESLQEFVAFDKTSFYDALPLGKINNQNLHGVGNFDMVIITHRDFKDQANRLAEFHAVHDDLSVLVVEPQLIYNEFSSGAQDITAIRDFMKMLYDQAPSEKGPRYLLLFGKASYDYKNRIANNTNFVPTWQSMQSLNPISSYINDDFFGLLDGPADNLIDLGIGRYVVSTPQQAKTVVDKTMYYAMNQDKVMGDWRNIICLIADDEDNNLHFNQAEEIADTISAMKPEININKIYLDAYNQVSTPSGARYPDVTLDLTNRVNRGALLVHYIGHGGPGGMAHERILQTSDVHDWNNLNNMPVFLTATCDFSPFDDPGRVSIGEMIALSEKGAGVALFSTTRATFAGANMQLSKNFYRYALSRPNGEYLRMGDILRYAKNATGNVENKSKFSLLGNPALKFAFPEHHAVLKQITDVHKQEIDTIKALLKVTITGDIRDINGNKLTSFNGVIQPTVYDKPSKTTTLGNDPGSFPAVFYHQKNILYKGKAEIINGDWSFTFIAPKDLAYQYGFGKISLYAKDEITDGTGYYNQVIIGGYNQFAETDTKGPRIDLFMNDTDFTFGGLTDENPKMLAYVFDESGINTAGAGIGHDIIVTLNDTETFVINDFYSAEMNDYKRGSILYPFYNLENGRHTLSLKLWDVYNNSSTAYTEFVVASSGELAMKTLLNYPNPFKTSTTFTFEHNQADEPLRIEIQIYAMNGQLVKTIRDIYLTDGYRYKSNEWDGTADDGSKLQGMFVYRLMMMNRNGMVAEETNKLVIIK